MQSLQESTALTLYRSAPLVSTGKVLVLVDPSVSQRSAAVSWPEDAEVVVLDAHRNGVEQITEVLSHFAPVSSLKIAAGGCPGAVQLGSVWLDRSSLETYHAEIFAWRQFLTSEAKILFYESNVAIGIAGMGFIGRLSQITGLLVAAPSVPNDLLDSDLPSYAI